MSLECLIEMQKEKNSLDEEWERIKICGQEHAYVLMENGDTEEKIKTILKYREKVLNSQLRERDKEARLKEIRENLSYLNGNKERDAISYVLAIGVGLLISFLTHLLDFDFKKYVKERVEDKEIKNLTQTYQR